MNKISFLVNSINLLFTIINTIFSIVLNSKNENFLNKSPSETLMRYNYLKNVLVIPYLKLMITSVVFDIVILSIYFLLNKYVFSLKSEKNEGNIRVKSLKENELSNILVEFVFTVLIKGVLYFAAIYYTNRLKEELTRLIYYKGINTERVEILKTMLNLTKAMKVFCILTVIYQFIFFCAKIFLSYKENNEFIMQQVPIPNPNLKK